MLCVKQESAQEMKSRCENTVSDKHTSAASFFIIPSFFEVIVRQLRSWSFERKKPTKQTLQVHIALNSTTHTAPFRNSLLCLVCGLMATPPVLLLQFKATCESGCFGSASQCCKTCLTKSKCTFSRTSDYNFSRGTS